MDWRHYLNQCWLIHWCIFASLGLHDLTLPGDAYRRVGANEVKLQCICNGVSSVLALTQLYTYPSLNSVIFDMRTDKNGWKLMLHIACISGYWKSSRFYFLTGEQNHDSLCSPHTTLCELPVLDAQAACVLYVDVCNDACDLCGLVDIICCSVISVNLVCMIRWRLLDW